MNMMLQGIGNAQQIPNFSLYNKNHYLLNPAASGVSDMLPISVSFRKQYAGFDHSPSVFYASGDMARVHTATILRWEQATQSCLSDCLFYCTSFISISPS
jgi:hypothetical protein